jgi:hypothetical protein
MEKATNSLNEIGNCMKNANTMRALDEAPDQARAQSVSLESERSNIDNLNSETTKIESVRQHNFHFANIEGSLVKICLLSKENREIHITHQTTSQNKIGAMISFIAQLIMEKWFTILKKFLMVFYKEFFIHTKSQSHEASHGFLQRVFHTYKKPKS